MVDADHTGHLGTASPKIEGIRRQITLRRRFLPIYGYDPGASS